MVVDDVGTVLSLDAPPRRIVSLIPSTTETLFDLGVGDAVVGVTRFCVRPVAARQRTKVGGTKDVDVDAVLALRPQLVLANKEENLPDAVQAIAAHVPVYLAATETVDDAVDDLVRLGTLLGREADAASLVHRIGAERAALTPWRDRPLRTATFIWRAPWMVAGGDTFVSSVMAEAGFANVFADRTRYPAIDLDTLATTDPEAVLLPTEPFPFKATHAEEVAAAGIARSRIGHVDGQALTWHGSRLVQGLRHLRGLRAAGIAAWMLPEETP